MDRSISHSSAHHYFKKAALASNSARQAQLEATKLRQTYFQHQSKHSLQSYNLQHQKRYTPFPQHRGQCTRCEGRCFGFIGNWMPGPNFLHCRQCGCPMSSHQTIQNIQKEGFSKSLWQQISKNHLSEEMLLFGGKVLILGQQRAHSKPVNEFMLIQRLQEVGQSLLGQQQLTYQEVIKKITFSLALQRQNLNDYAKDSSSFFARLNNVLIGQESAQKQDDFDDQKKLICEILHQAKFAIPLHHFNPSKIRILLVKEYRPSFDLITPFLNKNPIQGLSLLYESKTPSSALSDVQCFFPSFFKLHYTRFHLLVDSHTDEDAFKDYLLLNAYTPIQSDDVDPVVRAGTGVRVKQQLVAKVGIQACLQVGPKKWLQIGWTPSGESERAVIILRPYAVKSGLTELLINIFRINGFGIISSQQRVLSSDFVSKLASFQGLTCTQAYKELMMGFSNILVVSKANARLQASLLLNGQPKGLRRDTLQFAAPQYVNYTLQEREFEQVIQKEMNNGLLAGLGLSLFSSIKDMISLRRSVFGVVQKPQYLKDLTTGKILQRKSQQKQFSDKRKSNLLVELSRNQFNFIGVALSDHPTPEDCLSAYFFPQHAIFQHALILIKPPYSQYASQIINFLQLQKFIIAEHEEVSLARTAAFELVGRDQQTASYYTGRIHILMVVKPGGMNQLSSILYSSNIHQLTYQKVVKVDSSTLPNMVVLGREQLEPRMLPLLSSHLDKLQLKLRQLYNYPLETVQVVSKFMLSAVLGTTLVKLQPLPSEEQDQHRLAITPLGRFHLTPCNENAILENNYYYHIAQFYPQRVPLVSHHRKIGSVAFQVTTFAGKPFYQEIEAMRIGLQQKNGISQLRKGHRSAVLLIWAKKLASWIKAISQLSQNPGQQARGFGPAERKNGQWIALRLTNKQIYERETSRYRAMSELIGNYLGSKAAQSNRCLQYVLQSECFKVMLNRKNLRLQPTTLKKDSLRIDISLLNLSTASMEMINYELTRQKADEKEQAFSFDYCMVKCLPSILPEQMLFGQVWTILQLYKSQFNSVMQFQQEFFQQTHQEVYLTDENPLHVACFLAAFQHLYSAVTRLKEARGVLIKKYRTKVDQLLAITSQGIPDLRLGLNRAKFMDHLLHQKGKDTPLQKSTKGREYYDLLADRPKQPETALYDKQDRLQKQWDDQHFKVNMIREEDTDVLHDGPGEVILRMKHRKPVHIDSQLQMRKTTRSGIKPLTEHSQAQSSVSSVKAIDQEVERFMQARASGFKDV